MVDSEILLERLRHLRTALGRIREKNPQSADDLFNNPDTQDVVLRNFQNAVQSCLDIASHIVADEGWGQPTKSSDFFLILGERKVLPVELAREFGRLIKFRNILVHEYTRLDLTKAWAVISTSLIRLEWFAQSISTLVDGSTQKS